MLCVIALWSLIPFPFYYAKGWGCQWGVKGTPDVWDNINFTNLKIVSNNAAFIATGTLNGYLSLNNVISQTTPWAIRKNYGTVNPPGRVVVNGSDIKNLYQKTDAWYDAICTISLRGFAVANAYHLSPKESGKLVDSSGITATTTVNLPVATAGLDYSINRASTGAIRVKLHGIDKINGSAVGKYLNLDSQGAFVHLICDVDGVWQVRSTVGITSFEH